MWQVSDRPRWARLMALAGGGFVTMLGAAVLVEYAFEWDLGIDQLLFTEPVGTVGTGRPGLMAPTSGLCFFLSGSAMWLMGFQRRHIAAGLLAGMVAVVALLTGPGFLSMNSALAAMAPYTRMALHTALGFGIISTGIIFGVFAHRESADDNGNSGICETPLTMLTPIVFSGALMVMIGGFGLFYFRSSLVELSEIIDREMETVAVFKTQELGNWVHERKEDAKVSRYSARVQKFLANPDDVSAREEAQSWLDALRSNSQYRVIALYDKNGGLLLSSSHYDLQRFGDISAQIATGLSHPDVLLTDFNSHQKIESIHLGFLAPIRGRNGPDGAADGLVMLTVDTGQFIESVVLNWPTQHTSAEVMLVKRDGREIVFLSQVDLPEGPLPTMRLPIDLPDLPAAAAVAGLNGVRTGIDYRGTPVLAVTRKVEDTPWFIVAKVNQAEIFAPLKSLIYTGTGITLAGLLIALFATAYLWERHQRSVALDRELEFRREAEESLLEARTVRDQAEKLGKVGSWSFLLDSKTVVWSKAVYMIHEVDEDFRPELESGINFYTPSSRPVIERAVKNSIVNGEPFDVELEILTAKGNLRTVHSVGEADLERRVVFGYFQDITAQKKAEQNIRKLNNELEIRVQQRTAELETSNAELESFAYSVSHDLRAPLRSIDGFSRILQEDYADKLDEEGIDSLNRVRAATQRMGLLIDDMLKLSRASRIEMTREDLDLTAMAQAIAADLQRHDPERKCHWTIEPGLVARGDLGLIQAVLENLLGNAWKFTAKETETRIELVRSEQEGKLAFAVRDNGVGFAPEYADKLFSPFQRLHAVNEFAGNGIGLASVQRILRRHGGGIWGRGEVNQGATFTFTLPGPNRGPTPEIFPLQNADSKRSS